VQLLRNEKSGSDNKFLEWGNVCANWVEYTELVVFLVVVEIRFFGLHV
jgi:hypothetical protein